MTYQNLKAQLEQIDFKFEKFGWEVHEYQRPVNVDGIYYCHNYPTGVMGKPISGDNVARALLLKIKYLLL